MLNPRLCCSFAPEKMAIHCSWLPLTNHIPMFDSPKTRVPWRMNQLPCLLKDFVLRIDSQRRPPSNVVGFRQVFTSHLELNVLRRWRTSLQRRSSKEHHPSWYHSFKPKPWAFITKTQKKNNSWAYYLLHVLETTHVARMTSIYPPKYCCGTCFNNQKSTKPQRDVNGGKNSHRSMYSRGYFAKDLLYSGFQIYVPYFPMSHPGCFFMGNPYMVHKDIPYNWVVLHPRKISYNNQGTNLWSGVTIRMITLKMDENGFRLGRRVIVSFWVSGKIHHFDGIHWERWGFSGTMLVSCRGG